MLGWSVGRKIHHLEPDGGGWPDTEWMSHRHSPGNPFDCTLYSVGGRAGGGVWVISGRPHGFFRFMASFLLALLTFFGPSLSISVSLSLSLLLCVGLWSLKVLENEEPATTAGWDSLWACLDPSPSCPFLSDGRLQALQCRYSPAVLGLHLIKPALIVKGRELELGLSLTLFVSCRDSL